jgi:hypothetical protein
LKRIQSKEKALQQQNEIREGLYKMNILRSYESLNIFLNKLKKVLAISILMKSSARLISVMYLRLVCCKILLEPNEKRINTQNQAEHVYCEFCIGAFSKSREDVI